MKNRNPSPRPKHIVDFNPLATRYANKESHLHSFKAVPNEQGNRAERRAAKKKKRKQG